MDNPAAGVDKRANLVDKIPTGERPFGPRSPDVHRPAQTVGLTPLRTLGPRSLTRSGPERVRRGTSERDLFRGYGLDPDDAELEGILWGDEA